VANFAVVGAGLFGRFVALLLEKNEHQVHLFEQGQLSSKHTTGRIAAAMVAPVAESVIASENIVSLGKRSLQYWPQLLSYLGLNCQFQQHGSLVLAHRQDKNELKHFRQRLTGASKGDVQELTVNDINLLEPEITGQFNDALYLPFEGHIDNHQLFDELEVQIRQSNITLFENTEVDVGKQGVRIDDKFMSFDHIIDCRGLGAKYCLVNKSNALRGVRGEVARVRAPEVNLSRPVRLMHPRYPLYIVPKADHQYVIGATEIESEDDKPPTVRSTLELLSAAYSVHKGFAEAEIIDIQAGLRPTLLDNEPEISQLDNVIQINGLYRHGYLLTPALLAQLINQLQQQGVDIDSFTA